jgi:hypothetical protein
VEAAEVGAGSVDGTQDEPAETEAAKAVKKVLKRKFLNQSF